MRIPIHALRTLNPEIDVLRIRLHGYGVIWKDEVHDSRAVFGPYSTSSRKKRMLQLGGGPVLQSQAAHTLQDQGCFCTPADPARTSCANATRTPAQRWQGGLNVSW